MAYGGGEEGSIGMAWMLPGLRRRVELFQRGGSSFDPSSTIHSVNLLRLGVALPASDLLSRPESSMDFIMGAPVLAVGPVFCFFGSVDMDLTESHWNELRQRLADHARRSQWTIWPLYQQ